MNTLIRTFLVLLMLFSTSAWAAPSVPFRGGLSTTDLLGSDLSAHIDAASGTPTPYLGLNSGVLTGGEVTINGGDNTKFDVAAGTGAVISWVSPGVPSFTYVTWDAFTAVTVDEIATERFTTVGINAAGSLVQDGGNALTAQERRTLIALQGVIHVNNMVIDSVAPASTPAYETVQNLIDIVLAMGPINSGNTYTEAGTDLTIKKLAGTTTSLGINRVNDLQDPNVLPSPEQDPVPFIVYSFRDGVGGFNTVVRTVIDPDQFDDGSGTLAALGVNKVQIQRLVFFGEGGGITLASYGQFQHSNQADALISIMAENPVLPASLISGSFTTALIVERNNTDLSDSAEAMFVNQE